MIVNGRVRNGAGLHKARRPVTEEERAAYAAFGQGETYSAIARRIGRSAAWVTNAVERVHDEDRDARLASGAR